MTFFVYTVNIHGAEVETIEVSRIIVKHFWQLGSFSLGRVRHHLPESLEAATIGHNFIGTAMAI